MTRVISGRARGLKLDTLPGEATRPTADRVKEAFFNIIANKIPESCFADVFSGTGGMGCEALSRGSRKAVFIESNPECNKIIVGNVNKTRLEDKAVVYNEDFRKSLPKIGKQDIIFLDPPYNKGLGIECLELISKYDILNEKGIAILEHDLTEDIPDTTGRLMRYDMRKYGRSGLSFYKLEVRQGDGGSVL